MRKRKFSHSEVRKITGASRHEPVRVPFYYAPPFLDRLQESIESRLSSRGGRPTLQGAAVVRKVRFSKKHWEKLGRMAKELTGAGTTVSPAQVASSILDQVMESAETKQVKSYFHR